MPNPYESIVGDAGNPYEAVVHNDAANQLRESMASAVDKQPDVEARINQLAQKYQIPVTAVRLDTPEVERRAKLDAVSYDDIVRNAPKTSGFLSDPNNAAVAQDDIPTLSSLEKAVRAFVGGGQGGEVLHQLGRTYLGASAVAGAQDLVGAGAKLLDAVNPFTTSPGDAAVLFRNDPEGLKRFNQGAAGFLPRVQTAMSEASDRTMENVSPEAKKAYGSLQYATTDFGKAAYLSPVKVIGDAVRSLPTSAAMALSVYLTRGAAARAEADALAAGMTPVLARQAGMAAGAKTMAEVGALSEGAVGYAQQQGQTAYSLSKLTPEDWAKSPKYQALIAQGYSPEAAQQATIASTSEQAGILAGIVDAAVNHVGGAFLGKILTEGGRLLPRIGKGATTEALTEFFQSGGEQLGENLAMKSNIDPTQDLTKDVLENMMQGLFVGGVSGGAFAGFGGHAHDEVAAKKAEAHGPVLQQLMALAAASKLRERDASTFAGFMQQATEDGPLEKVYINPKEMHDAGIDLTQIAQLAPDLAPHIAAALNTGTDIALPTAQLLTSVPGTALEQPLLEHLKTDPGGFSQAGAKAFMQNQGETVRQEVEKALAHHEQDAAFKSSMKAVEANVLRQLQEANRFTDDVNAPYAALWSSFFGVQAARLGVMPQELFDRYGPRIVAQSPVGGSVLEQQSQGDQFRQGGPRASGSTATSMLGELRKRFGDVPDKLQERGVLKLWDNIDAYNSDQGQASRLPAEARGVQGMYSHGTGTAHLFADGVEPGHAVAVFLHEVGEHASMKAMLGAERYRDLVRRAYALAHAGDEIAQIAMMRIPEDTKPKFYDSEFLAYMIEEATSRQGNASAATKSWLDEVISAIKAWFFQSGLAKKLEAMGLKVELTPADIAALAVRAARWQAQQGGKAAPASGGVDIALSKAPATDSAAFKRWFGGSKVVDAEGKPLVVYHGTRGDFDAFDRAQAGKTTGAGNAKLGFFFTDRADVAGRYARMGSDQQGQQSIVPAHLSLQNPLRLGAQNMQEADKRLQVELRPAHDGAIISVGEGDTAQTVYMVRNPTQIKSATGNNGEFDPADANILHQEARGTFNPETNTVALLQAADLSTFLHESGHFFLEVMDDLAAQPNAPKQIVDDFATFLKWTGVEGGADAWRAMSLDEKRAHHEDFARGFEAYLFEGKAPSIELQGVFQRFRAWLLNVYRSLTSLNIHLTPEVRGVFDRMLATTEQIQLAEDVRGYEALFKNKPEGMTDDEWHVYQLQSSDATQQAVTDLEKRSLGDMKWLANAKSRELKKLQAEAKNRRDEIAAEARKEVEAEPVYQAIAAIKEQRKSDPHDREAVTAWTAQRDAEEERLTGVIKAQHLGTPEGRGLAGLQKAQFLSKNKRLIANEVEAMLLQWEQQNPKPKVNIPDADLEAVAQLHGFTSGDELRRAIMEAPPLNDVVQGMTDQRMLERHGDLVTPEAIERAAEEAIHNEARMRFVATETNALRKAVGQPALLAKAVRQFAADIVARTRVRDLKASFYTAAEKRSARDAEKAMRENKLEDAAIQKRNQLVNGYAAKETMEAGAEVVKIVRYLAKFNKDSAGKSLDAGYLEQIHNLLERFDLRPASNKAIDKRTSLKTWLEAQAEAGLEPDIPPELVEEANRTHFKNLTMEQLRGLRDTVKQIEHLGRLKHKLLTAKDQRDYEAIRDSIVASIIEHAGDKVADNRTRPTAVDSALRMASTFVLEHRKLASLIREMDGFKDGGVLWEYMVRTMNEAGDKEATMRADAATKLAALVRPMLAGGKRGGKGQFFPSVGASFNREERLGIALNMGNAGNLQRLLDGEGWTLAQVKPIVDTLTASDWHFVQGVWDFLESYRPLIAEKERRVYGKEPEWVEPQALTVQTADGQKVTLRGGYYPVKYDARRSQGAEQNDAAQKAKEQMQGAFTSSTTRRSFTKSRVEAVTGRPLMYSTDGLFNGVNEIIHDLSWHEWLIDANKLMRSKSIDGAIRTRYGAEVVRQLKSAIKDIAAGEFPATHAFERGLGELRAGTAVAGLGLNIMNSIINVQGLTQSMVRIGSKWTAVGIGKFATGPIALSQEVATKSAMMANRAKTLNREVNEIQSLVRDKSKVRQAVDRMMFMPLTITQQLVDLPTWWGAYQKALSEGQAEDRAVNLADQAVLDAQSGGQVKDLAAIQRGGPLLKLWTTFYGFFNSTYNLTVEQTKATDFHKPGQVVQLATNYLLLWTIPALLGTLLKNAFTGADWDEDKLAKKIIGDQISYLMGMLVGLRDFAGAAQSVTGTSEFNTGYGGPSGGRFFGEVYKLAQQANQGDLDMALFKALDNVVGILFKLPSGQINRTAQGVAAINEGKTQNPAAVAFGYDDRH